MIDEDKLYDIQTQTFGARGASNSEMSEWLAAHGISEKGFFAYTGMAGEVAALLCAEEGATPAVLAAVVAAGIELGIRIEESRHE